MGMDARNRTVMVELLPEKANKQQASGLLREITRGMSANRPCVVLDCSHVRQLDRPTTYLLLCCLEQALMRNGDVKLAALPPAAKANLQGTALNRLFEVYETTTDAVNSFRQPAQEPGQEDIQRRLKAGRA